MRVRSYIKYKYLWPLSSPLPPSLCYYYCSYGMIASLSTILGQALTPHLPTIIPRMIESLQSDEGIKVHTCNVLIVLLFHCYILLSWPLFSFSSLPPSPSSFKAYYSSFAVSFLNFEDESESADSINEAEESIESLEDDQDIEGWVSGRVSHMLFMWPLCSLLVIRWRMLI